jgi:hypothetical protein
MDSKEEKNPLEQMDAVALDKFRKQLWKRESNLRSLEIELAERKEEIDGDEEDLEEREGALDQGWVEVAEQVKELAQEKAAFDKTKAVWQKKRKRILADDRKARRREAKPKAKSNGKTKQTKLELENKSKDSEARAERAKKRRRVDIE